MSPESIRRLEVLPDGTVQQQSALTGTVVWTVPGRSHRPMRSPLPPPEPLPAGSHDATCAFCPGRYLETPPEKARLVLDPVGSREATGSTTWRVLRDLPAERLTDTTADFRRIPNLFEILPLAYWRDNHGYDVPDEISDRARQYVATPAGRAHALAIARTRMTAAGLDPDLVVAEPDDVLLARSADLFASLHDVIVARRHFLDGATLDDELCSAGDLTPAEHHAFLAFTVEALHDLTTRSPLVRYVSVFQNWLRPAGASFDHLHKQLVAIDEHGPLMARTLGLLRSDPELFNHVLTDPAAEQRLVVAENEHAIALAGVGHRYPTVEIISTAPTGTPWEHDQRQLRGMSDLLHACHAATGRLVPSNEEWHYRPVRTGPAQPWRVNLKWRISTLAGFEGGTKINVNTISPFSLRTRMVRALTALRATDRIAAVAIGDECSHRRHALAYADS